MYYPTRMIRTDTHKLILNLDHHTPFPLAADIWGSRTWQGIRSRKDKMMGSLSVDAFLHRPAVELYDLNSDPHELHNLANNPASAAIRDDLRRRIRAWQRDTNDPWLELAREE